MHIKTPVGEIYINLSNSNFAYIGSSTVVWDNTKERECEYKLIYNSTGIFRSNVYAGRLIDSGAKLEYLFDLTEAIIPCPGLNLTYTNIHLVDGLTNTFIAFNSQSRAAPQYCRHIGSIFHSEFRIYQTNMNPLSCRYFNAHRATQTIGLR